MYRHIRLQSTFIDMMFTINLHKKDYIFRNGKTPVKSRDSLWTYHTVHIHGHDFYTMSIGHPVTDEITGRITGLAPGVECDNEAGFHIDTCYTL